MEISLEEKANELAEVVERPAEEILAELEALVREKGYSPVGALVKWKSDNKFQLGTGKQEWIGRLIAREAPRTTSSYGKVTNVYFAVQDPDTGEVIFKKAGIWGEDRVNKFLNELELNKVYRFKASEKPDGSLTRISKIEEVSEDLISSLDEIEPVPMDSIADAIGKNELVRGIISKVINIGDIPAGFEITDTSVSPPLTVWFGGQYSKLIPEDLQRVSQLTDFDEVCAFGFIPPSSKDIHMNAINIVRVGN